MPWIKQHLFFVILGATTLILMGVAGFFLFTKIKENTEVQERLNAQVEELKSVYNNDPFPNPENLEAAKLEAKRVKAFKDKAYQLFTPPPTYSITRDRDFNSFLNNTIAELNQEAAKSGVMLPLQDASQTPGVPQNQYAFTFSGQKDKLQYATNSIGPWLSQLGEIRSICHILFNAKINVLESLQRVPVSPDDVSGTDYLGLPAVTNSLAVFRPYKATFVSFSAELASVLEGILRSTNCIIVKNIEVVAAEALAALAITPSASPEGRRVYAPPAVTRQQNSEFDQRYGLNKAPSPYRPPPVIAAPGAKVSTNIPPVTILTETPIRVTLLLDVVTLNTVK